MITDRDDSANLIYIECETGVHKTARSLQMKYIYIYIYIYIFLPLMAPCIGIANRNWGEVWLDVRKQLKIESLTDWPLIDAIT